ncbi:MAG TPA: hypothetical protein VHZ55_24690 [Bryobacteraceae bacterium]|nr:hypothetical protein [Bryobacteraceae bacterium]
MRRKLVYEVTNLREGLIAEFDRGQIGTLGTVDSVSNFSKTVDGRSVRRNKRRNDSVFVTNE